MKKIILACLLTTFANITFADENKLQEQTNTETYTQLCLAALKSEQEFVQTARALGITKKQRDRLVCNDMEVDEFARNHELIGEDTIATVQ